MKPYGNLKNLRWPKRNEANKLDLETIEKMNRGLLDDRKKQREIKDWQRDTMLICEE